MINRSTSATAEPGSSLTPHKRRIALFAVTGLFFMWGFITCLNDIIIPHLKGVFDLNYVQALLIQLTFFGAYFLMSLPAGKLLSLWGYQRSMIIGLLTAGAGTLLFLPSASLLSYPLFLGALFVLATGITILQVAANPYISALGRPETASSRLNLAQAFNSLGTTIAPWLGGWLIFSHATATTVVATDASRLAEASSVKVPYLILTGMLVLLAIIISRIHLPTIPAVEGEGGHEGTLWDAIKIPHVTLGAVCIFVYVGAEVGIGSLLISFLGDPQVAGLTKQDAAFWVSVYWGFAMFGRFVGSALLQVVRPNQLLMCAAIAAAVLATVALLTNGHLAMGAALLIGLFNSVMFPTIFTLGIAEVGLTSRASSLLIMAIVGGAIIPLLMGRMADIFGIHHSFFVPAFCYLYIVYYGMSGYKTPRKVVPVS